MAVFWGGRLLKRSIQCRPQPPLKTRRKLSSVTWSSGAARWGCPFSVYCFPHRIAFVWAFSEVVIWKESWQSAFRVVAVG